MKSVFAFLIGAVASVVSPHRVSSDVSPTHATVRLIPGPVTDSDVWVGLEFRVKKDWHIYWTNPGDAGSPPTARWRLPAGWLADSMRFPLPHRLIVEGLGDYVYESTVVLPVRLRRPIGDRVGDRPIAGAVDWVVCRIECFQESDTVSLTVHATERASDDVVRARTTSAMASIPAPLPATWHVAASVTTAGYLLRAVPPRDARRWSGVDFFPDSSSVLDHAATPVVSRRGDTLTLALTRSRYSTSIPSALAGLLTVRDADGRPAAFTIRATVVSTPVASGQSVVWLILAAAIAGVLVNVMPCALPLLGVKIYSITISGGGRGHALRHAAAFAIGTIVAAVALGGSILLAAHGVSHAAGWGLQMQSPAFVAALAIGSVTMGLLMLDVIMVPDLGARMFGGVHPAKGLSGTLLLGGITVVAGTPCAAPLFGATLAAALTAPISVGVLAFASFGVGVALPMCAALSIPGVAARLPRAGAWTEVLKHLVGFSLFGVAAWTIWLLSVEAGPPGVGGLLTCGLAFAFAGWMASRAIAVRRRVWRFARLAGSLALLGIAIRQLHGIEPFEASPITRTERQLAYTDARRDSLLTAGRTVLVDFTAAWCLTCQVNERLVLGTPTVRQLFTDRRVTVLRADLTTRDSATWAALNAVGRQSLPTYALFTPGATRSAPTLLPELLTTAVVRSALDATASRVTASIQSRN